MSLLISSLMGGGVVLGLTGGVAALLGRADKAFHVDEDPRIGKIKDMLPGANCGGCGFVGCGDFAEAVVKGEAEPTCCPAGGEAWAAKMVTLTDRLDCPGALYQLDRHIESELGEA